MNTPSLAVLCKIGSIVVHVEEFLAPGGHPFDMSATSHLLLDPDVQAWLQTMRDEGLLPVKRTGEPPARPRRR